MGLDREAMPMPLLYRQDSHHLKSPAKETRARHRTMKIPLYPSLVISICFSYSLVHCALQLAALLLVREKASALARSLQPLFFLYSLYIVSIQVKKPAEKQKRASAQRLKSQQLLRTRFSSRTYTTKAPNLYFIRSACCSPLSLKGLMHSTRHLLHSLPLNDEARSGRRDLNPQPQPWQGYALPLSYFRQLRQWRSTTEQFTYHLIRTTSVFPPDHTLDLRSSYEHEQVGGWAAFSINLRPLSAALGASCKESWSRVELGPHFILVTGVSAPQDQTSCSLALHGIFLLS